MAHPLLCSLCVAKRPKADLVIQHDFANSHASDISTMNDVTRRKLLSLLIFGGGGVAAGSVAVPALITAFSPAFDATKEEIWKPVGSHDGFSVGDVVEATVEHVRETWPKTLVPREVFVWRQSEDEFVVFSRSCTDLGCPLDYEPGSTCFFCPCHGGVFRQDGVPLAGPSRIPLYRFAHRVREGVLEIDLNSLPAGV